MKLYIARHGLTDWNKEMRTQGRKDLSLNAEGRAQAKELRDKIKDITFTAVYTSPLKRAAETAQIAVGDRYEIISDDRLMERSLGNFEGKKAKEIDNWLKTTDYNLEDLKLNLSINNIEPIKDVLARTKTMLDDIKTKHNDTDIILIVTHGQAARGLHHNLVGYTDDTDWWSVNYDNAEVKKYEL